MLEALDRHGIRATVSLNLAVLDHYPEIGEAMIERDWEFMSHGIYNTRYLTTLDEEEEREFYRDCIETFERHTGQTLKGMLGPAVVEHVAHAGPHGRSRPHLPRRLDARRPAHAAQGARRAD